MPETPVFLDPSGIRAKIARSAILAVSVIAVILLVGFGISLSVSTIVGPAKRPKNSFTPANNPPPSLESLKTKLNSLARPIAVDKPSVANINLGFYAPWEQSGLDSFKANAPKLTHVSPAWLSLDTVPGKVNVVDFDLSKNPDNAKVIEIAKEHGVRIIPLISNSTDSKFLPERISTLVRDAKGKAELIQWLVKWCKENQFQGINLDFEEIRDQDYALFTKFLAEAHQAFQASNLELSLDIQTTVEPEFLRQWATHTDYVVAMTYDEHDEYSESGPIASIDWVQSELDKVVMAVPADKIVMGIGSYAYDWKKSDRTAEAISFQEAMAIAQGYRDSEAAENIIELDGDALNNFFEYSDDDDSAHTVWMLDGISAYNQWQYGQHLKIRGAALWSLGTEDPAIWKFLDKDKLRTDVDPKELEKVDFPFEIDYTGKGEILKVKSRPQTGSRTLEFSKEGDITLVDGCTYQSFSTPFIIQKSGFVPKKLVLTFDDGPDPEWTPKILEILKSEGVPATFFIVGANAEAHPKLVQRAFEEGHEIGSHTFFHPDLGLVNEERATLELAATQRIIEVITGHSTTLFRPPYNADSQPQTAREIAPLNIADKLGYITVGENIDPNDWDPTITDDDGTRPRTAQDIAKLTVEDIVSRANTSEEGNIILLHDAGGDRSQTVAALPQIIRQLKAKGYQFVTTGTLLSKTIDQIMPPVPAEQRRILAVDQAVFLAARWAQILLASGFLLALFLGGARVLMIMPLAIIHNRKQAKATFDTGYQPKVSVLIAAYNEEKTIVPTIESVLKSNFNVQEIVVIDDGSKDGTLGALRTAYPQHPLVKILTKENGGKATALNFGLEKVTGELLFCIDADTQLDPNAIGKLARQFSNPKIGAVAGNVQVGNVHNILTAWQAVEYRTSQNMDRRAYALLNAITVVPGAIGMWRKSAISEVGAYQPDTLAEDMDLTWRLRRAGYQTATEPDAVAFTEAPESWSDLMKQRFRWSYGTLQCLWKHRTAIGRYGFFGTVALPSIACFQILFQILGPLVDLQILISLLLAAAPLIGGHSVEFSAGYSRQGFMNALSLYAAFFSLELISGAIAYRMDRVSPLPLLWLFVQRFAYRQLMYLVMLKSIWKALAGARQGWGKLRRTGSVNTKP